MTTGGAISTMAQNRSVEAALLAWVFENHWTPSGQVADLRSQVRTFPLEAKVESFADLNDGFVLSKMLGRCAIVAFSVYAC